MCKLVHINSAIRATSVLERQSWADCVRCDRCSHTGGGGWRAL